MLILCHSTNWSDADSKLKFMTEGVRSSSWYNQVFSILFFPSLVMWCCLGFVTECVHCISCWILFFLKKFDVIFFFAFHLLMLWLLIVHIGGWRPRVCSIISTTRCHTCPWTRSLPWHLALVTPWNEYLS